MSTEPKNNVERYFGKIGDPRRGQNIQHKLLDIITIALCGIICGADNWVDVEMFGQYLRKVVLVERDMEKATKLVRWLDWVVEVNGPDCEGKESWRRAVKGIKGEVQTAAKQRGLAPLRL